MKAEPQGWGAILVTSVAYDKQNVKQASSAVITDVAPVQFDERNTIFWYS